MHSATHQRTYPVISNANDHSASDHPKRALLLYLPQAFLLSDDDPELFRHQNLRRCKQIAAVVGEFGYIVDVANARDRTYQPTHRYDLLISDRANLRLAGEPAFASAIRLFLATATQHQVHKANLQRRHDRLVQRRGCHVRPRRVHSTGGQYISNANAIIGVGNDHTMGTWRQVFAGPIYNFNNYGYRETAFISDGKDFSNARRHFLFFASRSQVQKGLDLLLEIFPRVPNIHLYVCSDFKDEADFLACYRKELYETPNVYPIGRILVNGPEFYDLVRRCAYVIHPTCSEGQPGSVVQCMYAGLIPLVTREAGIDTERFGVTFADDSLEEIERVILEVSGRPEKWHRKRSVRTRRVAEKHYSEDALVRRWREILAEIIADAERRNARL